MKLEVWAIINFARPGDYNLVGLFDRKMGTLPCASTFKSSIETAFRLIHPDIQKTSKIVKFTAEVELQE